MGKTSFQRGHKVESSGIQWAEPSTGPLYRIVPRIEADVSGDCGEPRHVYFRCGNCERLVKITVGCGKRFETFCPSCAKRWRNRTFRKYWAAVVIMKAPKLMTLTLKKHTGDDAARLLGLWELRKAAFKEIRRRGYSIRSWVAVIEPPNHIHLIVDSEFIPQRELSQIWHTVTGDSFIVDIRKVNVGRSPKAVAVYITKYLSKASKWEGINLDRLEGFHLIGSNGLPPRTPPRAICVCDVRALVKIDEYDYDAELNSLELISPMQEENRFGIWINSKRRKDFE